MKRLFIHFIVLTLAFSLHAQQKEEPIRVACIGNSITFGAGIDNRDQDSYPAVLGQLLGDKYEVRNFGFSARTLSRKGDYPYMDENMYKEAKEYQPNIVIIKLGSNDTKPHNWINRKNYIKDLETMVKNFQSLRTIPDIYLCYPAKAYAVRFGIRDSIITSEIIPAIDQVARKRNTNVIDLHTATDNMEDHFPDKIHPNAQGAIVLAQTVYKAITGNVASYTPAAFPGERSIWKDHDRYDFSFEGRNAIVVAPKKATKGNPWIWRPAFFNAFPSVDEALLREGFHVVYFDLTHLYGSPHALSLGNSFYNYLKNSFGFSSKVTLEGFSRGGLFAINWAAKNPEKVACIYIDAPVCDIFSWPGRKNAQLWQDFLNEWGLKEEDMGNFKGNPIDNLEPLAKARIPIISVCGDSDKTVPFNENMDVVRTRYMALGGPVEVIIKPGVDHHPHSLDNPEPVVDFIKRNQPAYKKYQQINMRGSLQNSFTIFERERKGRVAFIGGSITEMKGWKDRIEEQLKQRFPYTQFEFVEAGISSTGSTPGAFRIQNDVLSKGKIDLLFVEAAVNDDTNYFTPLEQVRGMEGEVRHALNSNPEMDIIMLHFIYDPFIPLLEKGKQPDVILNHERVANHYLIPSINLAQEITSRMQDSEFTWKNFGGTHPSPFGHKFYAAAINRLFDEMSCPYSSKTTLRSKELPKKPLDVYSYYDGDFIDIKKAIGLIGFKQVDNWHPEDNAGKRKGFVDVPMLVGNRPNSMFSLTFKGKAIGIFCVAGPSAGILEYSIDGSRYKQIDTFTEWSGGLYIPWVYMFETELDDTLHSLTVRISKDKNSKSKGTECIIRNFVVNK